jgi:hypothetical protein
VFSASLCSRDLTHSESIGCGILDRAEGVNIQVLVSWLEVLLNEEHAIAIKLLEGSHQIADAALAQCTNGYHHDAAPADCPAYKMHHLCLALGDIDLRHLATLVAGNPNERRFCPNEVRMEEGS